MAPTPPVENEFDESSITFESFLLIMLAILTGVLAAILLLPAWLPRLATSLMGESPKVYWYLSRATAFVSLTILWISMALGIGISNKMARLWPGAPAAFAIHEYVSLLGMAFAIFHALVLLGDHYINFTVAQIFMPFATVGYRPTWVGIGQIGFYVWLIVNVSFYIRKLIGQKTWRVLHYLSFAMYIMGLVHGLFSGTDSPASWAQWYYWISGGSLLFLFVYRILNTATEKLAPRPKPRPVTQPPRAMPQPKPIGFPHATPQTGPVAQLQHPTPQPVPVTQTQHTVPRPAQPSQEP
jgi:predicted ferric reductase